MPTTDTLPENTRDRVPDALRYAAEAWRTIALVCEDEPTGALLLTTQRQVAGYQLLELAGLAERGPRRGKYDNGPDGKGHGVVLTEAGRTWLGIAGGHAHASARMLWLLIATRVSGTSPGAGAAMLWARATLVDADPLLAALPPVGGDR